MRMWYQEPSTDSAGLYCIGILQILLSLGFICYTIFLQVSLYTGSEYGALFLINFGGEYDVLGGLPVLYIAGLLFLFGAVLGMIASNRVSAMVSAAMTLNLAGAGVGMVVTLTILAPGLEVLTDCLDVACGPAIWGGILGPFIISLFCTILAFTIALLFCCIIGRQKSMY